MGRTLDAGNTPGLSYNLAVDLQQIVSGFRRLSPSDFDLNNVNSDGIERLRELADAVQRLPAPEAAIPEMFGLMERMPDVELGSPGPLVHTLEAIPGYKSHLANSVRRQPSLLSVWMVNRILNSPVPEKRRDFWMTLLQESADRLDSPEPVRQDACDFIALQKKRQNDH